MLSKRTFRSMMASALLAGVCPCTATAQDVQGKKPAPVPYTWKSVPMVGGGFVDGIISHPTAKGVRYARMDIGKALVSDQEALLDSVQRLRAQALDASPGPESAIPKARSANSERPTFQWKSALVDASIFCGIQHGFRLLQDPTVRQGLRGPFYRDYVDSLKNIHGWDDGDTFLVNYVGHPSMGAVAGYIEIHNDPRYRAVEFSAASQYWKSRLRAMGFSAAYSLQFEIGLISEASLGNVQSAPNSRGVVDWVITPTVGTAWIVMEDLGDKYLVRAAERHTRNATLMAIARSLLNPGRSFSNLVGRRWPWHRDDRPGVRSLAKEPY